MNSGLPFFDREKIILGAKTESGNGDSPLVLPEQVTANLKKLGGARSENRCATTVNEAAASEEVTINSGKITLNFAFCNARSGKSNEIIRVV